MSFSLQNLGIFGQGGIVTPYLTDSGSDCAAQAPLQATGGGFTDTLPARSLTTFVIGH